MAQTIELDEVELIDEGDLIDVDVDVERPRLGERYRLGRLLARGGVGVLYLAEDRQAPPGAATEVVIKVLSAKVCRMPTLRERLLLEARAMAAIDHPNVLRVLDSGQAADGMPFVVMERLHGESLADTLRREKRLAPERVITIGIEVARALAAAHERGIVHRDIKPANIFRVLPAGANPAAETGPDQVKLLDFGTAKLLDEALANSKLTPDGAIFGSPLYMAPEQCNSEVIDARADLYSLGATLFHLLVGRPPFEGSKMVDIMSKHVAMAPPSPTALVPALSLPAGLEALILGLLAKSPDQRPASASALAAALEELLLTPATSPDQRPASAEDLATALEAVGAEPRPSWAFVVLVTILSGLLLWAMVMVSG